MRPPRLVALPFFLAALLLVPQPASAGPRLRPCVEPAAARSVVHLKSAGVGCRQARLIARAVSRTRRNPTLYRQRRCRGRFCVRIARMRCRPSRTAEARERCRAPGRVVTWLWR